MMTKKKTKELRDREGGTKNEMCGNMKCGRRVSEWCMWDTMLYYEEEGRGGEDMGMRTKMKEGEDRKRKFSRWRGGNPAKTKDTTRHKTKQLIRRV